MDKKTKETIRCPVQKEERKRGEKGLQRGKKHDKSLICFKESEEQVER